MMSVSKELEDLAFLMGGQLDDGAGLVDLQVSISKASGKPDEYSLSVYRNSEGGDPIARLPISQDVGSALIAYGVGHDA